MFYNDENIKFFGCNLMDVNNCKIDEHFEKAADFINQALDIENGTSFKYIIYAIPYHFDLKFTFIKIY